MSVELIVLAMVGIAQVAGFTILGAMLYRMWEQTTAVGAASFLQGRKLESILNDMKDELRRLG